MRKVNLVNSAKSVLSVGVRCTTVCISPTELRFDKVPRSFQNDLPPSLRINVCLLLFESAVSADLDEAWPVIDTQS